MNKPYLPLGESFLLGFHGSKIPAWLEEFASTYSLGGVILFDYCAKSKKYENNILNPQQLKKLTTEIHSLPSRPLVFIDQEGGKVRRLKESAGFTSMPSQKSMNSLSSAELKQILRPCYTEMKNIGIDVNLAPVIDLNYNPNNPDLGKIDRTFSAQPSDVQRCVNVLSELASSSGIELCLKHFPGLGGATVNSHLELTDISSSLTEEQLKLFWDLMKMDSCSSVLVSHGIVQHWHMDTPCSLSEKAIQKIRNRHKDALIISDDIHMEGVQKLHSTQESCLLALMAGVDLVCIGNNMKREEHLMLQIAKYIGEAASRDSELSMKLEETARRTHRLKKKSEH